MKRITNLSGRMHCLHDEKGTILAAAGTDGSSKVVESISDADVARLGDSIHVEGVTIEAQASKSKAPANDQPNGRKE